MAFSNEVDGNAHDHPLSRGLRVLTVGMAAGSAGARESAGPRRFCRPASTHIKSATRPALKEQLHVWRATSHILLAPAPPAPTRRCSFSSKMDSCGDPIADVFLDDEESALDLPQCTSSTVWLQYILPRNRITIFQYHRAYTFSPKNEHENKCSFILARPGPSPHVTSPSLTRKIIACSHPRLTALRNGEGQGYHPLTLASCHVATWTLYQGVWARGLPCLSFKWARVLSSWETMEFGIQAQNWTHHYTLQVCNRLISLQKRHRATLLDEIKLLLLAEKAH